jgi:hypothetical protein
MDRYVHLSSPRVVSWGRRSKVSVRAIRDGAASLDLGFYPALPCPQRPALHLGSVLRRSYQSACRRRKRTVHAQPTYAASAAPRTARGNILCANVAP